MKCSLGSFILSYPLAKQLLTGSISLMTLAADYERLQNVLTLILPVYLVISSLDAWHTAVGRQG